MRNKNNINVGKEKGVIFTSKIKKRNAKGL